MATQLGTNGQVSTMPSGSSWPAAKILLVGEACAGKSTLVARICTGQFNPARSLTVGIDFQVTEIKLGPSMLKLIFWDVAGQERFVSLRPGFYRGGQAVVLVYDLTNRASFERLPGWLAEVQAYLPAVPKLVVGTKLDLAATQRAVSRPEATAFAHAHGLAAVECSCATGAGVTAMMQGLSYYLAHHFWRNGRMPRPAPAGEPPLPAA